MSGVSGGEGGWEGGIYNIYKQMSFTTITSILKEIF